MYSLLCTAMSAAITAGSAATVYAADEPDPINSIYEIDGVTYYDVGSANFSSYPEQYLADMLDTKSAELGGQSIANQWLNVGAGISYVHGEGRSVLREDNLARIINSDNGSFTDNGVGYRKYNLMSFNSLDQAEDWVVKNVWKEAKASGWTPDEEDWQRLRNEYGAFTGEDAKEPQTVFMTAFFANYGFTGSFNDGFRSIVVVYFTDFEVAAILPSDEGNNYVTEILNNSEEPSEVIASNVKNLTGTNITAEQNVSHSYSAAATNTVEGSREYTLGQRVQYGLEYEVGNFTNSVEIEFSASEALSSGWSEGKEVTDEDEGGASVSIDMPPYTNVMLSQTRGTTEQITRYNCPVGLQYKATVVLYDPVVHYQQPADAKVYSFADDSRVDLKKWGMDLPTNINPYNINFASVNSSFPAVSSAVQAISSHVPMSTTGASLSMKKSTTDTEVAGLMPIYPLAKIKLAPPTGVSIGSTYATVEYLRMPMKVGGHDYTKKFELEALNTMDYEYYGFSKDYGHWVVADEDGNEWTDMSTAPVKIVGKRFTAVRPGQCFLKFVIDEDVYDCTTLLGRYTKNEDLLETAMVEIDVTESGTEEEPTIEVLGSFTGYVGAEAAALDLEDGLSVLVCEPSGKEMTVPYRWEKKEADSKGFTLDEDGRASFSKAGVFHVRAVCDSLGIQSDWIEIEAVGRTYDVTFDPQNGDDKIVSAVPEGNTPSAPTMTNDQCTTFNGWFTDSACTQKADLSRSVTSDLTVYGGWTEAHDLNAVKAAAATCEKDGTAAHYVCRTCKKLFSDAKGKKVITAKETVIPAGHKMTRTKRKAPTCTEKGNIEYYTCSACKGIFADKAGTKELSEGDLTLNAKGHTWDKGEATTPASCEKAGVKTYTCLTCGKTKTEKLKAEKHDWNDGKIIRKASCTKDGVRLFTCVNCGEKKREAIKAPGHDWSEWKVTKAPTTSKKGVETCYCRNNKKHTKKRSIAKLSPKLKTGRFIRAHFQSIKKHSFTVKWNRLKGATRYVVYVGDCGDAFTDTHKVNAQSSFLRIRTVLGEKLKAGTYYKVIVVAYGCDADGKEQEIGSSPAIHVLTKGSEKYTNYTGIKLKTPKSLYLAPGETATVRAKQIYSPRSLMVETHRDVEYYSSDTGIATVDRKSGRVRARKAGTCRIYCVTMSGLYKEVTVKVK